MLGNFEMGHANSCATQFNRQGAFAHFPDPLFLRLCLLSHGDQSAAMYKHTSNKQHSLNGPAVRRIKPLIIESRHVTMDSSRHSDVPGNNKYGGYLYGDCGGLPFQFGLLCPGFVSLNSEMFVSWVWLRRMENKSVTF